MPHFTIEYSANLEAHVNMNELCDKLREAALETGIFPAGGTRVRAFKADYVSMADGAAKHGFFDCAVKIGAGRDLATRQKAGEHIYKTLELLCKPLFDQMTFALSMDIREMTPETAYKTNNIHAALS
jgi:5-carboxymethyl-2-hydroxymuconate isomerase